jgi:hypothetical protein
VKNLARLVLFFSLCFVVVFPVATAIRYLQLWIDIARLIPAQTLEILDSFVSAGYWALPVALFCSVLLSLSYTVRKAIPIPLSIFVVFILSCGITAGVSLILREAESALALPGTAAPATLGSPGLILTQGDTTVVLMDDPANPAGSRIIAIPGRPLIYQQTPVGPTNAGLTLPPVPFREDGPFFITSLFIDFSLTAGQLRDRLEEGLIPFGLYLAGLCFLLSSLRFVMELSSWPLANIFLGALVFRGVLALETFLDSAEIQEFIGSFIKADIAHDGITPLIFINMGLVVILYTALVSIARDRRAAK